MILDNFNDFKYILVKDGSCIALYREMTDIEDAVFNMPAPAEIGIIDNNSGKLIKTLSKRC